MARVREASEGCRAAREMSQAEVPINAIGRADGAGPEQRGLREPAPRAARATPIVRPTVAGRSALGS